MDVILGGEEVCFSFDCTLLPVSSLSWKSFEKLNFGKFIKPASKSWLDDQEEGIITPNS